MSAAFTVKLEWSADHKGGTKFYEVLSVQHGMREAMAIGHYGKISARTPAASLTGQVKVYGRSKTPWALQGEKEKGGYERLPGFVPRVLFECETVTELVANFKNLGYYVTASDLLALGLAQTPGQLASDTSDEVVATTQAAISAQRSLIATTTTENAIAGRW